MKSFSRCAARSACSLIGVAYVALVPWLGYPLAIALRHRRRDLLYGGGQISARLAMIAALGAFGLWFVFVFLLHIGQPAGIWPDVIQGMASMIDLAAMFGAVVASPMIIPAAFGGIAWGILGGALPGISPSITMALLLPFTYGAGLRRRPSCCSRPRMSARNTAARFPPS